MRPLLFLTAFLAASATANKVAGKFQALFFYHLYRYQVDAFGLEDSRMASGCRNEGGVCNFKAFMEHIAIIQSKAVKGADGKAIRPPEGEQARMFNIPEFGRTEWGAIGEGDDLQLFSEQFDQADFRGDMNNQKVFNNYPAKDNKYDLVMTRAGKIAEEAVDRLKADGKEPKNVYFQRMKATLKVHANARRYDQALKIVETFNREVIKGTGLTVEYTDSIVRSPVPGYKKIDVDATIKANQERMDKSTDLRERIRGFVDQYNESNKGRSHFESIDKADKLLDHASEACKSV